VISFVARQVEALQLAVRFLTTLPTLAFKPPSATTPTPSATPALQADDAAAQGLSLLWYPAVGLLLGALLTLACNVLPLPFYLQAVLTVALWIALTGGLHLDGVADCADAWVGGLGDRERTLLLLKDPLCGSMGVIALIAVLALKVTALAAVIEIGQVMWLWSVPLLARLSLLLLFLTTRYVREQGLGEVLAQHFSRTWARRVLFIIALALLFILPPDVWGAFLMTVLAIFFLLRWAAMRRLGGFTGDVAGAQVELVEVGLLLVLASRSVV
jgi:adenosylcobinamide-GDP ribazoletransferase